MTEDNGRCFVGEGIYQPDSRPGLLRCSSCGFVSADVKLSDEQLENLYKADYFFGEEYFNYKDERESLEINFRKRMMQLEALGVPRSGQVFEIGCAYGYFLKIAQSFYSKASGIDISKDAVHDAQEKLGVDAKAIDYLSFKVPYDPDLIVMWDVVEHLPRPDLFIEKAAKDLKVGGYIALTTGDILSLNAKMRGKNWRMIHPPTHLHYFSVPSVTKLLERNGFEVVHASHPGTSRSLRAILYLVLARRMGLNSVYENIASLPIWNRHLTLNLWDIMFVVARKA